MEAQPDIKKSFVLHFAVAACFIFFQIIRSFTNSPMEIPEAIHVDLVGLPDKVKSEREENDFSSPIKEEPSKEQEAEKEKEEEAIVVEKKETKEKPDLKSAMDAIKKFQEESKKKPEKKKEVEKEPEKPLKSTKSKELLEKLNEEGRSREAVKGNIISQGNSYTGDQIQDAKSAWGMVVVNEVRKYWELPEHLAQLNLKATAIIHIGEDGKKLNSYIVNSSGNTDFDAYVNQALSQVNFVPPPPEHLQTAARKDGMTLRFPLR